MHFIHFFDDELVAQKLFSVLLSVSSNISCLFLRLFHGLFFFFFNLRDIVNSISSCHFSAVLMMLVKTDSPTASSLDFSVSHLPLAFR